MTATNTTPTIFLTGTTRTYTALTRNVTRPGAGVAGGDLTVRADAVHLTVYPDGEWSVTATGRMIRQDGTVTDVDRDITWESVTTPGDGDMPPWVWTRLQNFRGVIVDLDAM